MATFRDRMIHMKIFNAVKRARLLAKSIMEEPLELPEPTPEIYEDTRLDDALARMKVLERINGEYFDVIERIEKERDQWKDMFFTQASEHQNAQALLQKMLADCSNNLRAALGQLNFFRKGADLELVSTPKMLDEMPKDLPEQYGLKMKKLASEALPQANGLAERDRIAATLPAASLVG